MVLAGREPGDMAASSSNTQMPLAQCQGQWGPTWEAGEQTAEPEGKSFRIGSTWEGSPPAAS